MIRDYFLRFQYLAIRLVTSWIEAMKIHAVAEAMFFRSPWRNVDFCSVKVRSTTQRRGSTLKRSDVSDRLMIATVHLPMRRRATLSLLPAYPSSANTWRSHGKRPVIAASTSGAPSRSWMSAVWTTTWTRLPTVSVRMCRLRPFIFLPAS